MKARSRCTPVSILLEKCPICTEGEVFKKGPIWKMPEMHVSCPHCGYKFEREPGYFLGAMYISYAIAVFFGLLTFLACRVLFPGMPLVLIPTLIVCVILAIARKNYKLSRILYICIFPW